MPHVAADRPRDLSAQPPPPGPGASPAPTRSTTCSGRASPPFPSPRRWSPLAGGGGAPHAPGVDIQSLVCGRNFMLFRPIAASFLHAGRGRHFPRASCERKASPMPLVTNVSERACCDTPLGGHITRVPLRIEAIGQTRFFEPASFAGCCISWETSVRAASKHLPTIRPQRRTCRIQFISHHHCVHVVCRRCLFHVRFMYMQYHHVFLRGLLFVVTPCLQREVIQPS
mmetsp:Transcript_55627/g.180561  ORF Transcript_55627/g.180561 Transcript_55627/m.180561 type:complete len:227 (+) Transcript_55627:151-831(+)